MLLRLTTDWVTGIKHFECVGGQPNLIAYLCGANRWTYGFGRMRGVREGMTCTPHEAELMLQEDIEHSLLAIARLFPGREFSPDELGSMVSFIHNFGEDKFKSYNLYALIRDRAPESEIKKQWLKYQYTIRDEDADGDLDAVIDRGLPIRRYRELLMRDGFSFEIASAAANENTLDLREERVPWGDGGFKERLVSRTPYEAIYQTALSIQEFEAEDEEYWEDVEEPLILDDEIFEADPLEIPEPPSRQEAKQPEPVVIIDEAVIEESMPEIKPTKPKREPFEIYDPKEAPKNIAFSKRVHGLFLIVLGWFTTIGTAIAEMPFIAELAAMSPFTVNDWKWGIAILMAGFLLHWYGQVKAKGPLK